MRRRSMFSTLLSGDNGGGNEGGGGSDSIVDNYLTLEALEDGFTAQLSQNACEYCVDGDGVWLPLAAATDTPAINAGQTISLRAEIVAENASGVGTISTNKPFNAKGNALSLIYGDNAAENNSIGYYGLAKLFEGSQLVSVSKNLLPATQVGESCYYYLFAYCSKLINAPDLPAEILSKRCYSDMFRSCTSLLKAPVLPALSLVSSCYMYMFFECSSLSYIKAMFLTTPTDGQSTGTTRYWVSGVSSTGTFVKNAKATWIKSGNSGVPSGWTIETATE